MTKKKLIIITILVIIVVLIIISKPNDEPKQNASENLQELEDVVTDLNASILEGISTETYTELTGKKAAPEFILIGEDSYLHQKIDSKLGKKYDVNDYEQQKNKYANNVEKAIADNLESKIDSVVTSEEGDVVVSITYTPYYYALYIHDLNILTMEIMKLAGYTYNEEDFSNVSDKRKADYYKAEVKAMEIMDSHLTEYYNFYEHFETKIIFEDGDKEKAKAYIESYLLTLDGCLSESFDFNKKENEEKRVNFVKEYINIAISNGTLDKNNPLKLK